MIHLSQNIHPIVFFNSTNTPSILATTANTTTPWGY